LTGIESNERSSGPMIEKGDVVDHHDDRAGARDVFPALLLHVEPQPHAKVQARQQHATRPA
jgi:hypothetical protein